MISTRERLFEKKWKTLDARLRKMRSRRNSGEELSGFETRPNGGRMWWTEKVLRAENCRSSLIPNELVRSAFDIDDNSIDVDIRYSNMSEELKFFTI